MKEIKGIQVLETLEEIADPKHTALVIVDIQNDNASPKGALASRGIDISGIRDIIPRIKKVLHEARQLGLFIIFLRRTRSRDGSHESGPILRLAQKRVYTKGLSEYEIEGTWGNEVLDELEPRPNERQIIKYHSSGFIGTSLDLILRNRRISSVVVVGLVTEGCVLATVKDLEQYGYYPVVLKDCVWSHRKNLHEAALAIMSERLDVVTSEELLEVWHSAGNL
ncbi:MAG: isochorismatase family cysteine hydrolase [Thermodesulfobacteriota bacterium]|nr:isochorismatase family cysteine hydrolase [Thermodesulfobacteriota bacterium]